MPELTADREALLALVTDLLHDLRGSLGVTHGFAKALLGSAGELDPEETRLCAEAVERNAARSVAILDAAATRLLGLAEPS